MDYPKLVKIMRDEDWPDAWDWQRADGSSIMPVYAPILPAVLPKATPGGIAVIFEEVAPSKRERARIVCYALETFQDAGELLQRLAELRRIFFDTDRIYARLTEMESDFFSFFNENNLKFYEKLSLSRPPMATDKGEVGYHLNVFRELSRLHREIIFYPPGSDIPSVLSGIPELIETPVTDIDYPAAAAVLYGIVAAYSFKTDEPMHTAKKPYNPWARLDSFNANEYLDSSIKSKMQYFESRHK